MQMFRTLDRLLQICSLEDGQSNINVRTQQLVNSRSMRFRQQFRTQVGSSNGIGFFDDQFTPSVEATGGHSKCEGEEKTEQSERCANHCTNRRVLFFSRAACSKFAESKTNLDSEQNDRNHADEKNAERNAIKKRFTHVRLV